MSENDRNAISGNNIDNIEYIGRIRALYPTLPKRQKKVANYIFSHQDEVLRSSITTLAKKTGTSPATITRFCQALSFQGFSEFKVYISKGLLSANTEDMLIRKTDSLTVAMQKMLHQGGNMFTDTIRTLNANQLNRAINTVLSAKRIHIYGQSSSYYSALYGQQMLMLVGILSYAYNDYVNMTTTAGLLSKGDAAIGLAYSGEAKGTVQALSAAKKAGARIITITGTPDSTMAQMADCLLYYSHDIPDDLHYLYLCNLCEITILGLLQSGILLRAHSHLQLDASKKAILDVRKK